MLYLVLVVGLYNSRVIRRQLRQEFLGLLVSFLYGPKPFAFCACDKKNLGLTEKLSYRPITLSERQPYRAYNNSLQY